MNRHRMTAAVTAAILLAAAGTAGAAVEDLFWGAGSNGALPSGTHAWETPGNWTGDDVPNEYVVTGTGEAANIGDATGNRTISTSTSLLFHDLQWTQTTAGVVNKIQLGANWVARTNQNLITNSTADAATMVFDANGFQADFNSAAGQMGAWLVTWTSSAPGGLITNDTIGLHASAVVGPNLTLQANSTGGNRLQGEWDLSSTFRARPGNTTSRFDWIKGNGVGNILVGDGVTSHLMTWATDPNAPVQVIKGNVTVTNNARWIFGANSSGSRFIVGGNFIDQNTDALGYGGDSVKDDVLIFALSPVTARTVDIRRTGLTNDVQVGSNYAGVGNGTSGNIALAHDLATIGNIRVLGGSHVDVGNYTIDAGSFTADAGSVYTFDFGLDDGLIDVAGNLILNGFTLNLNAAANNGGDLILFNYGSLTGTPILTLGNVPGGLVYDAFLTDNNTVRLTNVWVPEPGTAALLVAGFALVLRRRR